MSGKASKPAPPMKKITINHGGKMLEVPELSQPVGKPTPELLAKYPGLNQPDDVAIVDFYLSRLEALKAYKNAPTGADSDADRLLRAVKAVGNWNDRAVAIASLQTSFGVRDPEEVESCVIKPRGPTLRELVDNGDIAEKLMTRATTGRDPHEYIYRQPFDRQIFQTEYTRLFAKLPKYSAGSMTQLTEFLGFMEADASVMDIRWMAYMLGTALIESSRIIKVPGANNKPKKVWSNFAPVEETGHGKGRDYYLPVKVKRMPDGSARITEQDGDQFTVNSSARATPISSPTAAQGAPSGGTASAVYNQDDGTPLAYFGRGYVQLTWWSNYASAGVLLGRGLEFLYNPELVMDPKTAYDLMSYCMRTGSGFANRRRFSQYFFGAVTDYEAARDMVNARGDHHEVAHAAGLFEQVLLAAHPAIAQSAAKQ